ncbi:MAG: hypothetical protein DRH08_12795, partial [Deltaproteobacteria bacterium]
MRKLNISLLAILLSGLTFGFPAYAAQLYGVTGYESSAPVESFYSVSTDDASTTLIQSFVIDEWDDYIAFNPDDGLMYHWSNDFGYFSMGIMEMVNLDDQTLTPVPWDDSFHNPDFVNGSTYDPSTGNFLFIDDNRNLATVTPEGVFSLIGPIADPDIGLPPGEHCHRKSCLALAFNNEKLYTAQHSEPKDPSFGIPLYEIDPLTGEVLSEVKICFPGPCGPKDKTTIGGVTSLTTDPDTGILYAILTGRNSDRDKRQLATIDPLTGIAVVIGPLPDMFLDIEFGPAADPIGDLITAIIDLLADPTSPAKAEKDLLKAIEKLEKAEMKLGESDAEKALGELAKAAKELKKAGKDGASVNDIMTALLDYARSLAEDVANAVRPLAGTNFLVDEFLAEMEADLVEAEEQATDGNVEKAIKVFKDAVKHANKAAAAVPHGELESV